MLTIYRERAEVSAFVKRCMALALLPANKIAEGVEFIHDQAEATEDDDTMTILNRYKFAIIKYLCQNRDAFPKRYVLVDYFMILSAEPNNLKQVQY